MKRVLVLLPVPSPVRGGAVPPPGERPIGRAALQLAREGIEVVFGSQTRPGGVADGWCTTAGGWTRVVGVALDAVYDRFPSQSQPEQFAAIVQDLAGLPFGNAPTLTRLCRDKVETQQLLERAGLPVPEHEAVPERMQAKLNGWGVAFLKPRYGAFGRGVRVVRAGEPLPRRVEGAIAGQDEPALLQRAILPPRLAHRDVAGVSIRVLVQATADGLVARPGAARISTSDPVCNADRGARVEPLDACVAPTTVDLVHDVALEAARAVRRAYPDEIFLEVGVDVVLDREMRPWIIELNGKPRGHLEVLAESAPGRFGTLHVEACAQPLRTLLTLSGR